MNWKIIAICYGGAFMIFALYLLVMVSAGQVFGETGKLHKLRFFWHFFVLLGLFGGAAFVVLRFHHVAIRSFLPRDFNIPGVIEKAVSPAVEEKQETDHKVPEVNVKLELIPSDMAPQYQYPKRLYRLMIHALGSNTESIFYFKATFRFPYSVVEINPLATSMTQDAYLDIQKALVHGSLKNTNVVVFNCSKWPAGTEFGGRIVVDLSQGPPTAGDSDQIGRYEGEYYGNFDGKMCTKTISGSIPLPEKAISESSPPKSSPPL